MLKEIRKELEHLQNIQRQIEEMVKGCSEGETSLCHKQKNMEYTGNKFLYEIGLAEYYEINTFD